MSFSSRACGRHPMQLVTALALVVAIGCGGGAGDTASDTTAAAANDPFGMGMEVVALTERDVESFLAATRELHALDERSRDRLGDDPTAFQGFQVGAEGMAILRKHGFDVPRYQRVGYSVMLAAAADDMKAGAADTSDAREQLESMKDQIPAEQYEAMRKALEGAHATMRMVDNQPAGNVELVRRYRQQIEDLSR